MGKLTSFGDDMFFSQTPGIQKMGKFLVLVLTCFSQIPGSPKNGEN